MFKIIVKGWKAEKYIEKCIKSILIQTEIDWQCFIVLDPSDDNTFTIAKKYEGKKINVFRNEQRMYGAYNYKKGIKLSSALDEDILVFLDADDWFYTEKALAIVKSYYKNNKNILVTHGSWIGYPDKKIKTNNGAYTKEEFQQGIRNLKIGSWKASHLKTMKYKVFKFIRKSDFKLQGRTWLSSACDLSLMLAALEIVGFDRVQYIPEILYVYNRETELNCDKVMCKNQEECAEYIITKIKPYEIIKNFENSIELLIFSKDRACQLDLLLRSIKDNLPQVNRINVLYKISNEFYSKGYYKLFDKYNYINWIQEENFELDVKEIINESICKYFLCLVDDEVIIRKPDWNLIFKYFDDTINNISLRLNNHINYSYTSECKVDPVPFTINDPIVKWDWTKLSPVGDMGYPSCINSAIRDTEYFKNIINNITFKNPNVLEAEINFKRDENKPFMLAFKKAISISIPNNFTQQFESRNSKKQEFSLEKLNDNFLNGYIINTNNLYGLDLDSATMPIDYNFIQG